MSFNEILSIDKWLFKWINGKMHFAFLDQLFPIIRHAQCWVPLYLFLTLVVLLNFKKGSGWWLIFLIILPIVSDFISSDLVKKNVFRLRPCNDPDLQSSLRFLLSYKPQSSSFTSSHATNHFALATFFYFTLKSHFGKWAALFFLWAFLICWAQIYVGVHYPGDVIAGALLGYILGWAVSSQFNKKFQLTN